MAWENYDACSFLYLDRKGELCFHIGDIKRGCRAMAKKKYQKPVIIKQAKMTFPIDIVSRDGKQPVCKQCSSCHGCR